MSQAKPMGDQRRIDSYAKRPHDNTVRFRYFTGKQQRRRGHKHNHLFFTVKENNAAQG